jgi:hypothetical protein
MRAGFQSVRDGSGVRPEAAQMAVACAAAA